MKHTARKIGSGNYEYRGFVIERISEYDFQQSKNVVQWNLHEDGICCDTCDTLRGARYLIDRILENRA